MENFGIIQLVCLSILNTIYIILANRKFNKLEDEIKKLKKD